MGCQAWGQPFSERPGTWYSCEDMTDKPLLLGVLPDPRNPLDKEFDPKSQEVFTSTAPTYLTSYAAASTWVGKFPIDNQYQTSSCVAHGKVLAMSIFNHLYGSTVGGFVQLSSMFVYRNRGNYPGLGMIPSSADTQVQTGGAPEYADLPTPGDEATANALVISPALTQEALKYAGLQWVTLVDPTKIDTIAHIANDLKLPLNILIFATEMEWSSPVVEILDPGLIQGSAAATVSHCITVLPQSAYMDSKGNKYVIIQDSADFGGIFFRSVSAEFIAARVYECAYPVSLTNTTPVTKPTMSLGTDLTVGSTGPDVIDLQLALQYLGYMPNIVNGVPFAATGYYGGMTKAAVLQLQNEYASAILAPSGLTEGTGYCGESTRAFLNSQFSQL